MADTEKLVQELTALDDADWFTVLQQAQTKRRDKFEQENTYEEPQPGITPEQFAAWVAQRQMASDPAVREVVYLPANAPDQEIRLLEINVLLTVPEAETVEFVEFSPDLEGLDFRILMADVTLEQWEKIKNGELPLPQGWSLDNRKAFRRGQKA